jgi:hypothetical protein
MINAQVRPPASATAGAAFTLRASTDLTNDGPLASVSGNVTFDLTLPADCSATTPTTRTVGNVSLPMSTNVFVSVSWSVTCLQSGSHSFGLVATVVPASALVADSNPANNSASNSALLNVSP